MYITVILQNKEYSNKIFDEKYSNISVEIKV